MQLQSSVVDGVVQVKLSGRLDLDGTQRISDRFAIATTTQKANIIVDLSDVTFIASIGIRLLITSARTQINRGGKLILAGPQEPVRKVLEVAGVDQLIGLTADVQGARASFAG
jgi:anti-sigma B factor antagonist